MRLSGSFVLKTASVLACLTLLLAGCAEDEVGGVSISSGETMELYPVVNVSSDISFVADDDWTAQVTNAPVSMRVSRCSSVA